MMLSLHMVCGPGRSRSWTMVTVNLSETAIKKNIICVSSTTAVTRESLSQSDDYDHSRVLARRVSCSAMPGVMIVIGCQEPRRDGTTLLQ